MSRTWHHGDKAKKRKFGLQYNQYLDKVAPPKVKRWSDDWYWANTPGWWIALMHTTKRRRETRDLLMKTIRLKDYEDTPLFPLDKKPHIYYW
jgi:hypothetical protein